MFHFRNYCFVEYEDEDDGKKALELLNGQIMNGVRVLFRVANSDPKTPEEMVGHPMRARESIECNLATDADSVP